MNERDLQDALRRTPIDPVARERSRRVVLAAHGELAAAATGGHGRRRKRRRTGVVVLVAACLAAALVMTTVTRTPTDALGRWLRDAVGLRAHEARPALGRVPGGGRLLVTAGGSAWVVAPDGAKRRLGSYAGASWSPRGLFVVGWRGGELTALEPDGDVRWSLRRPVAVRSARWAPGDGYRIAYVAGASLRIVNGDGTDDRHYARALPSVAPAWRSAPGHVLAYADPRGRVRAVDVDRHVELWRTDSLRDIRMLAWSADAEHLMVLTARGVIVLQSDGARLSTLPMPAGERAERGAWGAGGELALVSYDAMANRSELTLLDPRDGRHRVLFTAPGALGPLAWSPDGRTLLLSWPVADQWLFLSPGRRARPLGAVADVAAQFAPGASRARSPSDVTWAAAPAP